MEAWIEWARGPMFWGALTFMLLGLARHAAITLWEIRRALRRAGDKNMPYRKVLVATLKWLLPVEKMGNRFVLSLTSVTFHIAVLFVPLFLAGHIALWERGTGMSWVALPKIVADVLTIIAVVTAVALVVQRAMSRPTRSLSRFQDYALPLLIAIPFATGFLVMHPQWNPVPHSILLLAHVVSANLLMILVPITKISHCVLLPLTQLVSEVAWHFPPNAGSKVGAALGKEGTPI